MSLIDAHVSVVPSSAKPIIEQMGAFTRELAKQPVGNYEIVHAFEAMATQLRGLESARHAASAIKEMYKSLPWLEAVTLEVTYPEEARPELSVSDLEVADEDEHYLEDYEFVEGIRGWTKRDELFSGYEPHAIFDYNLLGLYSMLDYHDEYRGEKLKVKTSRDIVERLCQDDVPIDALAAHLFPSTWNYLSKDFDLCPAAPNAIQSRPRVRD